MEKKEFVEFCKNEFLKHNFRKVNQVYFCAGKEVLCGIRLQKSNYGDMYYVNYFYFLDYNPSHNYPSYHNCDIENRILVMSKAQTYRGEKFMTAQIAYREYEKEELEHYFDIAFNDIILPPINCGKHYILENLNKKYFLTLNKEKILKKLQS